MSVHEISGYKTSRDYKRLWELAQRASVICIVDYGDSHYRDVAQTIFSNYDNNLALEIKVRGVGYIYGDGKSDFIAKCTRYNVEFVEPNMEGGAR